MKILLVNNFFYRRGGAEVSLFETARLLEEKGHQVIFFSTLHPQNLNSPYNQYFVSQIDFDRKLSLFKRFKASERVLYSFEARNKIARLIKQERPDIVHLNNFAHHISPSILSVIKTRGIPMVMTLRDYMMVCPIYAMLLNGRVCEECKGGRYYRCFVNRCTKGSYLKSALNTIEMYWHHWILNIYNLIDIFIAPSRFLMDKVKEMGFTKKMAHLPNFIASDKFAFAYHGQDNSAMPADRQVVYFGRLSKEKGLFTLLEAIREVDIKLKIIGDGPLRKEMEDKVKERGLSKVDFLGYKTGEDLKEEIRKSLMVLMPSKCYENNPRTIIEAFALGKPVIGARIGGIPELVKDNETGLTFQPGNANDLRQKIKTLLDNPEQVIQMGKKARAFVEKELNPDKHYHQLMEIYQDAIRKHKVPG